MRTSRWTTGTVAAAILLAACSGAPTDGRLGQLAARTDRVAELVDGDRPCQALEAVHTLEAAADTATLDGDVRSAVTEFATATRQTLVCRSPAPSTSAPSTAATPSVPPTTPAAASEQRRGQATAGDNATEDTDRKDPEKGKDKKDDKKDDKKTPGEGGDGNG